MALRALFPVMLGGLFPNPVVSGFCSWNGVWGLGVGLLWCFSLPCGVYAYIYQEAKEGGENGYNGDFVFLELYPYFGEKVYSHHYFDGSPEYYYSGYVHSNVYGASHEIYLKSFVDLFTIADAGKVHQLATGRMYVGGFPITAASINSRPYELIRF